MLVRWPLIWIKITQKSDWKGFKLAIHSMWLVIKGDRKVKFELHVYMKCIEFYFVVVLSPTLHIDHPSKNQSMTIIPGTNTSQAIVNIPSSTSGNKTVCVDVYWGSKWVCDNNIKQIQWNLFNATPGFSNIQWHPTKIYGPKVFLLTKIKLEYSDILYNPTHFPRPMVWRIKQVPL